MSADLKRSGITPAQASKLGLKLLTPKQTVTYTNQPRAAVPSYLIPYYNIKGKGTDYWRIRYLEAPTGAFGARMEDRRYTQPPATPPHLYFTKTLEWANPIATDSKEPIIITEGEKKAAAGCLAGFPTIGLGGVWSWKSAKFEMDMLPEFDLIEWKGRKVYLCFDSDMNDKPQVAGALHALANALLARGALVMLTRLPSRGDSKVGLDDFLVRLRTPATKKAGFMKLLAASEQFSQSKELYALNEEVAVIQGAALYYFPTNKLYANKAPLKDIAYAGRTITTTNAAGDPVRKPAFDEWLKWTYRRTHNDLTYEPGAPLVTADNNINTWSGWAVEPTPGDVKPFLKLLAYLMGDEPEFLKWFLQWLAYPLQHPGTKLNSSVVLWSPEQGVGKTFVGLIMGDIYGENYLNLTQEALHGHFNE